ncbi:MAG: hypothetical protein Q9225_007657 [Loekoesia sp. 1 TL-2023]
MDVAPAVSVPCGNSGEPVPRFKVVNEIVQINQDADICRNNHKRHRDAIAALHEVTENHRREIKRIDSETAIRETDLLEQIAGLQVQQTFDDERNDRRLRKVEDEVSNAEIDREVMQRQHQDSQETVLQRFRELGDQVFDIRGNLEPLMQKHQQLENNMKQSTRELQRTFERALADHEAAISALRCVQRDVKRFAPPQITLEELEDDLSKLMIDEQACHDTMNARIDGLEKDQTTGSASIEDLRDYLQRLEARTATLERSSQARESESSQSREEIHSQIARCVRGMQGNDAILTNIKTQLKACQTRVVAMENENLSIQNESDQAQEMTSSQLGECAREIQRLDLALNNIVALQESQSGHLGMTQTAVASLEQEHSDTRKCINRAMEGEIESEMSRKLVDMESRIRQFGGQLARLSIPSQVYPAPMEIQGPPSPPATPTTPPTPPATAAPPTPPTPPTLDPPLAPATPPTQPTRFIPLTPPAPIQIIVSGYGNSVLSSGGVTSRHYIQSKRRRSFSPSPDRTTTNKKRVPSRTESPLLNEPLPGNRRCNGGSRREYCTTLAIVEQGQSERTPYTCTRHQSNQVVELPA